MSRGRNTAGKPVWLLAALTALVVLAFGAPTPAIGAGKIEGVHPEGPEDFDARTGLIAPTAQQQAIVSSLGARATWNNFGTPHTLVKDGGFLATGVSGANAVAAAKNFLNANKALFRLADASALELHNDSLLARSEGHAVTFRQAFGSLDAWPDGIVTVGLTGTPSAGWKVAWASSTLTGATSLSGEARVSLAEGWRLAAASLGRAVSLPEIRTSVGTQGGFTAFEVSGFADRQYARAVAFVTPSRVVPAVEALVQGSRTGDEHAAPNAYRVIIDARNGAVLMRNNRVHQFHQNNPPQTFNGNAPAVAGACAAFHDFAVPANTASLEIGAFSHGTNDIVLQLWERTPDVLLKEVNDRAALVLRPGPEAIHWPPSGSGVAAGDYAVRICNDPGPILGPGQAYTITLVINDAVPIPTAQPFPPVWKVFPANPLEHTMPQDPWGNPDTDIRKLWCWAPVGGCDEVVGNLASRVPWDVDGFTQQSTFTTVGNNANSGEAWAVPLAPGPFAQKPVSSARNYNFTWSNAWFKSDCSQNELVPAGNDIHAAVTNLFAIHNRMHDWSYHLGFTELNWNGQQSNFGNVPPPAPGGVPGGQGDPLIGQSQAGALDGGWPDYLGRDNANMITNPDGISSTTNMYLWQPLAAGFYAPCVDGDYDDGIIGHEFAHMIENRMIGKGDARNGHHAGAMGESTADLNAMEMLNEHGTVPVSGENQYSIGSYATGNKLRAIRNYGMNFAYTGAFPTPSVTPLADPLNFSDMGYDITGGQVHADGEIWSKVNFDIRQALVTKYNGAYPATNKSLQSKCAYGLVAPEFCPGNRRWIQIVYDAYLLMPTTPSMLDARDAYLAADLMRATDPDPLDPNLNSNWPSNQTELWREFAYHGFGVNASSTAGGANPGDTSDTDPKPNFESPLPAQAPTTVTFTSSAPQGGAAGPPKVRIYVGQYEARVSAIADTDPATNVGTGENNLDEVAKFVRGTYQFIAHAPGYGHVRFTQFMAGGGQNLTINLPFPTNHASMAQGATVTSTNGNVAFQNRLIDDTEATHWERLQAHNATTGAQPDVAGSQATIKLAGTGPIIFNRVQVSALLGPGHNRFQALRQFEVFVCTTNANPVSPTNPNPTCDGGLAPVNGVTPGFKRVLQSSTNAFPGVPPRPAAPDMILRSFKLNVRHSTATHVQIRVATNQCTGNSQFQGDQDADVSEAFPPNGGHRTDCRLGAFPFGVSANVPAVGTVGLGRAPQNGNVRIAEFQVFSGPVFAPIVTG